MNKNRILMYVLSVCMVVTLTACVGKEKTPEEKFADAVNSTYDNIKNSASSYMAEYSNNYSTYEESSEASELSESKKKIDPFKDLKITYTGSSPYIKANTDSTQCDSTVNEYIEFKTEDKYLRNGDEFTVTAVYNEDALEIHNLAVTSDTKTYVVENQAEYINSVEGLDLTALQAEFDDKLATVTATVNDYHSWSYPKFAGVQLNGYVSSVKSKTLKATYLTSLKKQFEEKYGDYNVKNYNRYMQIYEYVINQESGDGSSKGSKKVYVVVYADDLNLSADKILNWDLELGSKGSENYDNLVTDYVTSEREYYNVTEIK